MGLALLIAHVYMIELASNKLELFLYTDRSTVMLELCCQIDGDVSVIRL